MTLIDIHQEVPTVSSVHALLNSAVYSDKMKQLLKIKFLANEQNVSVMYIDINAISLYLDLNIFEQDECFCSKIRTGSRTCYVQSKTSLSQIWVICHLLPFPELLFSNALIH